MKFYDADANTVEPKFSSSGFSLRLIFGLFGTGYTTSSLSHGMDEKNNWPTDLKVTANAVDLSASLSLLTLGVGTVISGALEGDTGETKLELDGSTSGSTNFINLDFGVGPIELLVGYRMWDIKQKDKTTGLDVESKWNEITAGLGIGF